ncbi:ABC transporter ATP-binding protein [Porcipelethomonas sp.]|uniref:ABC transporter ATP-binding protein n=1 Tax=Porcipelethomonas sp. TaxID=2981675 RepID=UPI00307710D6
MLKIWSKVKDFWSIIFFCLKLTVEASPKFFILYVLLDVLIVVVPFAVIYVTSILINLLVEYAGSNDFNGVIRSLIIISLLMLALNILNKTIESVKLYLEGLYNEIISIKTRHQIMKKAAEIDLYCFDSPEFYDEMNDASNNSAYIIQTAFQVLSFIRYFFQFCIAFVNLLMWNGILPILLTLSVIPSVIFKNKQLESVYSFQREHMKDERKIFYSFNMALSKEYAKDIRIYGLFPFLSSKVLNAWNHLFNSKKRITKRYTKILIVFDMLPEIIMVVCIFLLGVSVIRGNCTIGDFNYYQGIIGQVTAGIFMVIYNYTQIYDGKIRINNYVKFMNFKNNVKDEGKLVLEKSLFTIEFKNVGFRYNNKAKYVLKNLSFKIRSDQKIALVGVNGSGKSSIIKLLLRFYDPEEGVILINDKDIREYTIESVRKCFSPMFQDYCNYAFTVSEDVSISNYNESHNEEKVQYALYKSGAYEFVEKFPDKLNTYLSRQYEEGEELSGGQWQKIALSRMFFQNAEMYILDEPSSALDAESEDELFRKFEELYKDCGAILISHRLSNVKTADNILVIGDGKIIEQGNHKELMKLNGKYARMYNLQAKKYSELTV